MPLLEVTIFFSHTNKYFIRHNIFFYGLPTHILSTKFCTNSISFTLCLIKIVPCSNLSSCFTWMKVHTRVGTSKWNDLTDLDEGVVSLMHVQNVAKKSICKTWSCEKMCRMPSVYNGEKFGKKEVSILKNETLVGARHFAFWWTQF